MTAGRITGGRRFAFNFEDETVESKRKNGLNVFRPTFLSVVGQRGRVLASVEINLGSSTADGHFKIVTSFKILSRIYEIQLAFPGDLFCSAQDLRNSAWHWMKCAAYRLHTHALITIKQ